MSRTRTGDLVAGNLQDTEALRLFSTTPAGMSCWRMANIHSYDNRYQDVAEERWNPYRITLLKRVGW